MPARTRSRSRAAPRRSPGPVRATTAAATARSSPTHDDGRIEAEFEVDQNRSGVTWNVQVRRNGAVAFTTRATTRGRSGSFSVERKIANGPGRDRVTARARSPSGEVCSAAATI